MEAYQLDTKLSLVHNFCHCGVLCMCVYACVCACVYVCVCVSMCTGVFVSAFVQLHRNCTDDAHVRPRTTRGRSRALFPWFLSFSFLSFARFHSRAHTLSQHSRSLLLVAKYQLLSPIYLMDKTYKRWLASQFIVRKNLIFFFLRNIFYSPSHLSH